MLAHNQGQLYNASAFARGLDVKSVTTARYLDLMVDLLLVRRLRFWTSNLGRRLVKAPKTYIRDSGICHALLGIETQHNSFSIEGLLQRMRRFATHPEICDPRRQR